jgi:threonine/homoserine/homoserine lactone efflux protein
VLAAIAVKLTLALLGAINDIPFLSLILELIGLGYTAWFISRYLLTAGSRQELSRELENFKQQVFSSEN